MFNRRQGNPRIRHNLEGAAVRGGGGGVNWRNRDHNAARQENVQGPGFPPYHLPPVYNGARQENVQGPGFPPYHLPPDHGFDTRYDRQPMFGEPQRDYGRANNRQAAAAAAGARRYRNASASSDTSHERRNNSNQRPWRGINNDRRDSRGSSESSNNYHRNFRNSTESLNSEQRPRHQGFFGFKALEMLLEKDSDKLLMELSNGNRGIADFVKNKLTDDGTVLFIKILSKASESSFDDLRSKVLQTYLNDTFVNKLIKYLVCLSIQTKEDKRKNKYFWNDPDDFWNNLIKICQDIYDIIPTFARKTLPIVLKSLLNCFQSFETEHKRHISDKIKDDVTKLNEAIQELVKDYEEKEKENVEKKLSRREDEGEPPDDFRQISLYPNSYELLSANHGFLRRNVVDGPYRNVNHYLDVQFRLLREDFVGPLRTAINNYRSEEKKRLENVKIYKKVRFLNPETVNEQYCVRLLFDFSTKKKNFKYENSRRFMFGSLLCFTADNFKSIFFGKVADRKVEELEKGELIVGFDQNIVVNYNIDYLMVECSVYFEPYYRVLNVLQTMNVENFPMERYIINVEKNVQPPDYLQPNGVLETYKINGFNFFPLVNWPNVNFYNLNESQSRAFKAALTQEFCIIQGPPGTGKTFLGLKIAKTLLENKQVWYKNTPMLVICYTNHALDQFLEGITAFTENILRVGGQSKNEKLKMFNLRNRSRHKFSPALLQQRHEVQTIMGRIKGTTDNLKAIEQYDSVRAFDVLEDVVPNFRNSWFGKAKQRDILEWLLSGAEVGVGYEEEVIQGLNNVRIDGENAENSEESSDDEDNQVDENSTMGPQVDDLFEELNVMGVQCSTPLITLKSLETSITSLRINVDSLRQNPNRTVEEMLQERDWIYELQKSQAQYDYLNFRLVQGRQASRLLREPPINTDIQNPQNMSHDDRWHLYFYWLNLYKEKLLEKLEALNVKFREEFKVYEQMRDLENTNIMKDVLVVGMTTTGAARLRCTLQALKSPIVIVEEAAEVLEAHIITSLTRHCKHLILIGDHQQLKPSTANYNVETFFNLGISLFERMVINKIQLYTLNVQHRMRPEISSLITPTIYPNLDDHPSVEDRPTITGLDHCLYFIHHDHKEEQCEGTSKKNYHEAEFLIQFAKHLILNGYKPENITILAAYLGQMFEMQKEKKKHKHILENVRIAVLDNYQGEECDIILLSLVRNNSENKIGFLKIENRVCVALSRARNGFYIMGNMNQLCAASELWQKIRRTFDEQNAIGTKLSLRCQVHLDTVTEVEKMDDFLKISEGGCSQKCGAALVCGHNCASLCHILDRDHKNTKCRQPCSKLLCDNPLHSCKKMCYQECGPCRYLVQKRLPCEHVVNLECHVDPDTYNCHIPVSTILLCGHVADKPCYIDAKIFRCPHPCEVKVEPCGHACVLSCHVRNDPDHLEYKCRKKCARYRTGCTQQIDTHLCRKFCYEDCEPCEVSVKKKRTICPHVYSVACNFNVDKITCEKPCTKILPCSHKCKNKCHEPCGKCTIKIEKTNPICGHSIKVKCCEEPDRRLCTKKCPLKLTCGHPCTKKCNEPCTEECKVKVKVALRSPCGHTITEIQCCIATNAARQNSDTLLKLCNEPCRDQLKCEHHCSGSCGTCHQGRVHQRCNEKCGFPLVCNHPCEFPCRQACRPCSRPCPYKCKHGGRVISCKKKCGDVCTPCKEKCSRSCQHQKCTKFCSDICNIAPCQEPCGKILKCGHQCVGFCGDPCPPKCRVCDKEELTVIFFGFEEDEDARFVLLEDCGHIFESQGLDHWMQDDDGQIRFKECPQCKTPIKTTQRYSDFIKKAMADVAKVKSGFHGSPEEVSERRNALQQKLEEVKLKYEGVLRVYCSTIDKVLNNIGERLRPARDGRRQAINKPELSSIESKLQIVEHLINICANTTVNVLEVSERLFLKQANFIMGILDRDKDFITNQEIDDIQLELNRLSRMIEYDKIKNSTNFLYSFSTNATVKKLVIDINELLLGTGKFFDEDEQKVMKWLMMLSKLVASGIGISDKERRDIVKAMDLKQGHWYKCPNGHPYAIGECGGAMQESVCFCGAKIGGTHHRLLSDNSVATEMDGARHGAWSEAANMGNYGFQDQF